MNCKYCHLQNHIIDNCPTIVCKICKKIGHAQWLCKEIKPNNISIKQYEKKIEQKIEQNKTTKQKNLHYYLNLDKVLWENFSEEL
jgi:hypothetical protein